MAKTFDVVYLLEHKRIENPWSNILLHYHYIE
jgi:hypothetical protein